jgi:hypothetical protein
LKDKYQETKHGKKLDISIYPAGLVVSATYETKITFLSMKLASESYVEINHLQQPFWTI